MIFDSSKAVPRYSTLSCCLTIYSAPRPLSTPSTTSSALEWIPRQTITHTWVSSTPPSKSAPPRSHTETQLPMQANMETSNWGRSVQPSLVMRLDMRRPTPRLWMSFSGSEPLARAKFSIEFRVYWDPACARNLCSHTSTFDIGKFASP